MLQYIIERAEFSDDNEFFHLINDNISHETGGQIMTLAERLTLKSKLEEKLETARKMIADGVEALFVAKYTDLPIDKIRVC